MRASVFNLLFLAAILISGLMPEMAAGQDKPKAETPKADKPKAEAPKGSAKKVAALPKGKVKVLEAIVMEVKGAAQARNKPKEKWRKLKINDVLKPGAVIRTGRKSFVALRIGVNASVVIDRQTRVALPEMVQDGGTLRTRVKMAYGKSDMRVDQVGLRNDFSVATPTATLAVRGTAWQLKWDAVNGFFAVGDDGNRIRSIEVRYLSGINAFLSSGNATSSDYAIPGIKAFYETYVLPLKGAIDTTDRGPLEQTDPGSLENPTLTTGIRAAQRARGDKTQGGVGSSGGSDTQDR